MAKITIDGIEYEDIETAARQTDSKLSELQAVINKETGLAHTSLWNIQGIEEITYGTDTFSVFDDLKKQNPVPEEPLPITKTDLEPAMPVTETESTDDSEKNLEDGNVQSSDKVKHRATGNPLRITCNGRTEDFESLKAAARSYGRGLPNVMSGRTKLSKSTSLMAMGVTRIEFKGKVYEIEDAPAKQSQTKPKPKDKTMSNTDTDQPNNRTFTLTGLNAVELNKITQFAIQEMGFVERTMLVRKDS